MQYFIYLSLIAAKQQNDSKLSDTICGTFFTIDFFLQFNLVYYNRKN